MKPEKAAPPRYPEDIEIYSPEASDGGIDWPSRIGQSVIVIVLWATALWAVGRIAQYFGYPAWWDTL